MRITLPNQTVSTEEPQISFTKACYFACYNLLQQTESRRIPAIEGLVQPNRAERR